mmetsp:Transcript_4663/g.9961  ORF Transcript_4663/g.9961 Transcript_4663/m.9961 type:complete len:198 (+) Transcript_4663:58-651(+)
MTKEITFKCKCGDIELRIQGKMTHINCHCHSCVASVKCVEAKEGFDGISGLDHDGAAFTLVRGTNVEYPTDMSTDEARSKIGFVKVGEKGPHPRCYCTKCHTFVGAVAPSFVLLNRNALFNEDGSKFVAEGPVQNIMKKHAFDPSKVPEPSSSTAPFGLMMTFFPLIMGFGKKKGAKNAAFFPEDMAKVEVVPITWE